eukprot:1148310-Pelagomonas_calceolata.AAC.3
MNFKVSEEHAVRPYMATQQRIKEYVHEHNLRNRPHAMIWLSKVKSTATKWPALRECSQEPLQFYWFRATVKFFSSMLDSNSETLRRVLKADLHLAKREGHCWSAHVSTAFSGMRYEDVFQQKMLSASKIPMQDFLANLRYRQQKVWREADALNP